METFNNLIETTFDEIAEDLDGLQQYEQLHICSLDINTLKKYKLQPYEYYIVEKIHFNFQESNPDVYSVLIIYMDGTKVEVMSSDIFTNGDNGDYDLRQYGIKQFLEGYYNKYMEKNSTNSIYYFV